MKCKHVQQISENLYYVDTRQSNFASEATAAATSSEITSDYMRLSLEFIAAHRVDVQKNTYSIHFSVEKNKFLFSIGFL